MLPENSIWGLLSLQVLAISASHGGSTVSDWICCTRQTCVIDCRPGLKNVRKVWQSQKRISHYPVAWHWLMQEWYVDAEIPTLLWLYFCHNHKCLFLKLYTLSCPTLWHGPELKIKEEGVSSSIGCLLAGALQWLLSLNLKFKCCVLSAMKGNFLEITLLIKQASASTKYNEYYRQK